MYFVLYSPERNKAYVKIFKTRPELLKELSSGTLNEMEFKDEDCFDEENMCEWSDFDCVVIKGEVTVPRETKCFCVD